MILSIEPDGPAARAGVVVGDVLLALDGDPVLETDTVQLHLGPESVGKPIHAEILRGGAPMKIEVTPAERPVRER